MDIKAEIEVRLAQAKEHLAPLKLEEARKDAVLEPSERP